MINNCKHKARTNYVQGTFCDDCGLQLSGPVMADQPNATAVEPGERAGYGPPARHISPIGMPIARRDHSGKPISSKFNRLAKTEYRINRPKQFSSAAYRQDTTKVADELGLSSIVVEEALKLIDQWSLNEKDVRFDKLVRIIAALDLAAKKNNIQFSINNYCKTNQIKPYLVWRAVKRIRQYCKVYYKNTLPDFMGCLTNVISKLNVNDAVRKTAMETMEKYLEGTIRGDNPWVLAGACVTVGLRQQLLAREYPLDVVAKATGVSGRSISLSARGLIERFKIIIPQEVKRVPLSANPDTDNF